MFPVFNGLILTDSYVVFSLRNCVSGTDKITIVSQQISEGRRPVINACDRTINGSNRRFLLLRLQILGRHNSMDSSTQFC